MKYSREQQRQFLEDELRAEVQEFDSKLKTSASFLMERGEVFVAKFLSFSKSGEMRVLFHANRPVPRKGEYLYCMTLHKALRNAKNWGDRTYGDLIKDKTNQTEVICNWLSASDNPLYILAGFIGVDLDFSEWIKDVPGVVLTLGPNCPPYEYIAHLQSLCQCYLSNQLNFVLDADYNKNEWKPILLSQKHDILSFLFVQLQLTDSIILQGPPGTGKTTQVAMLCAYLCKTGASVLVTALTNRALIEIAKKESLNGCLVKGKVYKTKITTDEAREVPELKEEKTVSPKKGAIIMSTFYITSGTASEITQDGVFDYVVMDEASQALLPMIGAAKRLGKKSLFVGDINQLPPVIQIKGSKINEKNYRGLIEGLKSVTESFLFPTYQLIYTYRLTERAAKYTGIFYNNSLISKANQETLCEFPAIPFLHKDGGPVLLKTDMEIGNLKTNSALNLALAVSASIRKKNGRCEIAILSCMKETVRALQSKIYSHLKKNKILIDTVARVQGLTTDICIYIIPNTLYLRSLEPRLFNVATSRAESHTIIIADKDILGYNSMDSNVKNYLLTLENEFSFYFPYNANKAILLDCKFLE